MSGGHHPDVGPDSIETIAALYWTTFLLANPTEAHLLGEYPSEGDFEQVSRAEEDDEIARLRGAVLRAEALDDATLDDEQRLTRDVLVASATSSADLLEARLNEIAADPIFGLQTSLPVLAGMMTLPEAHVAEAMAGTLAGVGRHFHQLAQRHREGLAHGRTPAAFAVAGAIAQLEQALATPPGQDPTLLAFVPPADVDADAWRGRMAAVVGSDVRAGMAAYLDVLRDEVLPRARPDDQCGLSWLPDGEDAYDRTLRYFTSTELTAREIHEIGLAQIESLAAEYVALGPEAVGTADLGEILERLRSDPSLHFTAAQELVDASVTAMERAAAAMGEWFEVVPQAPCTVEATTTGAKAFYFPPSADGGRGGTFFINVEDPTEWGTFELESLAFHEGIPGHHLQLAIAAELPDSMPEFRKHIFNSAYAEGWGLYSERLGDEMGLYSSPLDRMGMLSADSLRACRLVVDTGLHALGWSRQQAVDFMVANSPMTEGICRPEVDRYVVSPGQATSYMIGRLEIQRMRREAEARLGSAFSIKAFHSAVLDSGSLPLGVLDRVVAARLP